MSIPTAFEEVAELSPGRLETPVIAEVSSGVYKLEVCHEGSVV
jgi:hypothetical protein